MSDKAILWACAAGLLLAAGAGLAGCAQPGKYVEVRLTAVERAGAARVNEPVTFGVPLPAGAVTDAQALSLQDGRGRPIHASFRPAQRHLADGSIQWVHVNALLSAPANGKAELLLTDRPSPAGLSAAPGDARGTPLYGAIEGGRATIVTGPAKLVLSSDSPNVIESAWFDPRGAFTADTLVLGGSAIGTSMSADGQRYMSVRPGSGSIRFLEQSSLKIVALVAGRFAGFTPDAPESLSYEARVTAYAGSPQVAIDYTIVNRTGKTAADKIALEDLSLRWTVPLAGAKMAIGQAGDGGALVGPLGESASIFQDAVDHYAIKRDGKTVAEGPGKSAQPTATGWLDLSNERGGVAVGVRDFWQTWPKLVSARNDRARGAMVRVALYPSEAGRPQDLYIGQARTHRITLRLHGADEGPGQLREIFAAANRPLLPVALPAWYCEQSQAYGPIASAGASYGRFAKTARHYDDVLDASMDSVLKQMHAGRTDRGVTADSYGWMNWGDAFFRRKLHGADDPDPAKNLSWCGNYYDFGFAMICQFLRTGELRYLDAGLRAGAYTADVFVLHHHPDPTLVGACHYCPPTYHAADDAGKPYVSNETNHAKAASVVARWQLLGDWRARQVADEIFNNALTLKDADAAGWRQPRGNGARLRILWLAHHLTGEAKYQDRAKALLDLGVDTIQKNGGFTVPESQRFMIGVALEGMIEQYWDRPDPAVLGAIQTVADKALREHELKDYNVNMAMAYGFLWQRTGLPVYLRTMISLLASAEPTDQAKLFGQFFRSTPWAMGCLHEAASRRIRLP